MTQVLQDIRYALRMLARNPGFAAVAVFTLALGIGANTAIFSAVNAILLRPLPFADPERLVLVAATTAREGGTAEYFSPDDFSDLAGLGDLFSHTGAASPLWNVTVKLSGEAERLQGLWVSGAFFDTLGVPPIRGRVFRLEDDRPGGPRLAVLSYGMWQRYFGGAENVLGRAITVEGQPFEVIGIMRPGFRFFDDVDLWLPLSLNPFQGRGRVVRYVNVIGRLKPGISLERAQAGAAALVAKIAEAHPATSAGLGVRLVPLHERVTGKARKLLLVLFGTVGMVLLIACGNVANLALARAAARRKDQAVRRALGASRWRLIRQALTESVALSFLAGLAGVTFALWGTELLRAFGPKDIPRIQEITVDSWVLAFTLLVSLITGIAFGLAPALEGSGAAVQPGLSGAPGPSAPGGRQRLRALLVIAEVALSMVLLAGAGLLVRSFARLLAVDPGFATDNLVAISTLLPPARYAQPEQRAAFFREIDQRVSALPGIRSVAVVSRLPFGGANVTSFLHIEGREPDTSTSPEVDYRIASSRYFQTMGIPLRRGRLFSEREGIATSRVAVINEVMARRFWPGEDPIGKRARFGAYPERNPWVTIVGIVGNVRHFGLEAEPRPEAYLPYLHNPMGAPVFVVRASTDPIGLIPEIRSRFRSVDPDVPLFNVAGMNQLLSRSLAQRRFSMLLMSAFAALALVLAAVGVYGVISYSVAQRTREIGIRMALGAQRREVVGLVLGQAARLIGAGVTAGLVAAAALTRALSGLLYGVEATDPATFAGITALLAAVALLAGYFPARRAARVDPMVALRYE